MKSIKKTASRTKKFVSDHRVGLAVAATIIVMAKVNRQAQSEQISFIKEKGLWNEYLCPEV